MQCAASWISKKHNDSEETKMEKIIIQKQFTKPIRSESVQAWISRDVSERLDQISNDTGISKQRIMDLLLKKAIDAVEVVDCEI
jgi:hypothetical protein